MDETTAGLPDGAERRRAPEAPAAQVAVRKGLNSSRPVPWVRLGAFYVLTVGAAILLITYVPAVQEAWATLQVSSPGIQSFDKDSLPLAVTSQTMMQRTLSMLLITLGALGISLPVAWVYMVTRRLRYDPSLVHSMIILPMVVAGIVVIVKDSVALAFSLAGIVAAVRFRNTLKDPKDAVYIFLTLGIGLAAGVQALDIALVMSFVFNVVVLVLWKFNLGSMYGEGRRDLLSIGNHSIMIARSASARDALRWRLSSEAADMDTDGILLVHSQDKEAARQSVEFALSKVADDWRIANNFRRRNGIDTFAVMLKLKDKKGDPVALLAELDEHNSQEIPAAEYLPFKKAAEKKDK